MRPVRLFGTKNSPVRVCATVGPHLPETQRKPFAETQPGRESASPKGSSDLGRTFTRIDTPLYTSKLYVNRSTPRILRLPRGSGETNAGWNSGSRQKAPGR